MFSRWGTYSIFGRQNLENCRIFPTWPVYWFIYKNSNANTWSPVTNTTALVFPSFRALWLKPSSLALSLEYSGCSHTKPCRPTLFVFVWTLGWNMLVVLHLRHFSPALIASPRPIWTLANLCKTYFDFGIYSYNNRITFIQKKHHFIKIVNCSKCIGMDLSNSIFKGWPSSWMRIVGTELLAIRSLARWG